MVPGPSRPFAHHKASDMSRLGGQHFIEVIPCEEGKSKKCGSASSAGSRVHVRRHDISVRPVCLNQHCVSHPATRYTIPWSTSVRTNHLLLRHNKDTLDVSYKTVYLGLLRDLT